MHGHNSWPQVTSFGKFRTSTQLFKRYKIFLKIQSFDVILLLSLTKNERDESSNKHQIKMRSDHKAIRIGQICTVSQTNLLLSLHFFLRSVKYSIPRYDFFLLRYFFMDGAPCWRDRTLMPQRRLAKGYIAYLQRGYYVRVSYGVRYKSLAGHKLWKVSLSSSVFCAGLLADL